MKSILEDVYSQMNDGFLSMSECLRQDQMEKWVNEPFRKIRDAWCETYKKIYRHMETRSEALRILSGLQCACSSEGFRNLNEDLQRQVVEARWKQTGVPEAIELLTSSVNAISWELLGIHLNIQKILRETPWRATASDYFPFKKALQLDLFSEDGWLGAIRDCNTTYAKLAVQLIMHVKAL